MDAYLGHGFKGYFANSFKLEIVRMKLDYLKKMCCSCLLTGTFVPLIPEAPYMSDKSIAMHELEMLSDHFLKTHIQDWRKKSGRDTTKQNLQHMRSELQFLHLLTTKDVWKHFSNLIRAERAFRVPLIFWLRRLCMRGFSARLELLIEISDHA